MLRKVGAVALLVVVALVAYFLLRPGQEADAEARFDGVHLCSPGQQAAASALAAKAPSPVPVASRTPVPRAGATGPVPAASPAGPQLDGPATGDSGNAAPFFSQKSGQWGAQEYDHGAEENVGCGSTIAQCGCAMTSVATVLSLFQVLTTPEGVSLNPSTLNAWFNKGAQLTGSGWVSQGYSYGSVVWTAANNFAPAPPGGPPGRSPAIRYKGWGSGSEPEIKSELRAGRPVILEVPGHFIAAVGLQGDQVLLNDPYYRDRTTLASYTGRVKSSRLFEPSSDLRGLVVTVPANLRVELKDSQGRTVGSLAKGDPDGVQKGARKDVPGSTYQFEEAWRDPSCTERPPPAGAGVNTIFIPTPVKGAYNVEVTDPNGGDTSAVVYAYDVNGKLKMETHGGGNDIHFQVDYDPGTPPPTPTPIPPTPTSTAAPSATPTPTARPANTAVPRPTTEPTLEPTVAPTDVPTAAPTTAATSTPSPTPSRTPTATATATPTLTPVPTPVPGSLTIYADSDGPDNNVFSGDLGTFTLNSNSSHASGPIPPGTYKVTDKPPPGWGVGPNNISCSFTGVLAVLVLALQPNYSVSGSTVTVNLGAGQSVICTFGARQIIN